MVTHDSGLTTVQPVTKGGEWGSGLSSPQPRQSRTGPVPAQEETGYLPITNHGSSMVCALNGSKAKIGPQLLWPGQNSVCPGGAAG